MLPDYFWDRPKPCMGGWGRLAFVVDPTVLVLSCHEAGEIPDLEFWNIKDESVVRCWSDALSMRVYRGTEWMKEPCKHCPDRERDFGGCRCQAFKLLGDAGLSDPACVLSPDHEQIVRAHGELNEPYQHRR